MGDLAGEAGVSAPDLAVGDHCAAQALAQVEVDEVVQRRLDGGCAFGAGRPVDVVVDQDRAVDESASRSTGSSSPSRNGASGRCTSRPVARSTGSAALTTAMRVRRAGPAGRLGRGRGAPARPPPAAPAGATCSVARAATSPWASTVSATTPSGATLSAMAEPRSSAQARSTSPTRPRPVVRSPVSPSSPAAVEPAHALGDRRLGDARPGGELGPGHSPVSISARSTCSSVSERSRSSEGLAASRQQSSQESCLKRDGGLRHF